MGIRYNARTIFDIVGSDSLTHCALSLDKSLASEQINFDSYTNTLSENVEYVPQNDAQSIMDIALAKQSVCIAVERHAGHTKTEFTTSGEVTVQYGKNLLGVQNVLGTGGIFKYGKQPQAVLESSLFSLKAPWSLKPKSPKLHIDNEYLLYAVGLLSQEFPNEALRIAKKYIKVLEL
jgi:uncharacterized protein (TIGR01319 family)